MTERLGHFEANINKEIGEFNSQNIKFKVMSYED